jgi:undecaprenyl-diphosphatase
MVSRRRRNALALAGAAFVFALLAAAVRLGWTPLLSADNTVVRAVNRAVAPEPGLVRALKLVTTLGGATVLTGLVGLLVVVLLIRRRYPLAAYLAVTALAAPVLDPAMKALVGRLRPVVGDPVALASGNSFPSGHALDSLICYGAMALVLVPMLGRYQRWLLAAVGVLVFLIGLSRVMLGVHFVSDVIGGWCLGAAWLGLSVFFFQRVAPGRWPAAE